MPSLPDDTRPPHLLSSERPHQGVSWDAPGFSAPAEPVDAAPVGANDLRDQLDAKWQEELRGHIAAAKHAAQEYARIVKESNGRVTGSVAEVYDLQEVLLKTNWVPEPDIPTREEEWAASAWIDNGDWP